MMLMAHYLDVLCVDCAGKGETGDGDACNACSGWGYIPTEGSTLLIEFLKRHGFSQSMSPLAENDLRNMLE